MRLFLFILPLIFPFLVLLLIAIVALLAPFSPIFVFFWFLNEQKERAFLLKKASLPRVNLVDSVNSFNYDGSKRKSKK